MPRPAVLSGLARMDRLSSWLARSPNPVPRYTHTEVIIGSAIMLGILLVIALVVLAIIWSRRGR
jgi:hypothetical protein